MALYLVKALGVFGLCQIVAFTTYLGTKLTGEEFEVLYKSLLGGSLIIITAIGTVLSLSGEWNKVTSDLPS